MASASVREELGDPRWRLSNLYWITDKRGRVVKFEPNTAQLKLLDNFHGKDLIPKARQLGVTTLCCLIALDEVVFFPNWNAAIIAHKLGDAQEIFRTKVRFPYEHLPEALRNAVPLKADRADSLELANGSRITVTTSARSGTLQRLHISEFGKLCASFPERAKEVVTGSLPAAEQGMVTIESTAEGQEGYFWDYCQRATEAPKSKRDWRLHFLPWWQEPTYRAPVEAAVIGPEDERYFDSLLDQGVNLTPEQRAWWVLTERDQGGLMKREYPATLEEAFEQAIEGAYFESQLAHATKHGHIGRFPVAPNVPVNTFWDLGRNDSSVIWLHQRVKTRDRFVGYYENSGEHISHYFLWLAEWARKNDATMGDHYWPHDGDREDLFLEDGRLGVAREYGHRPKIVPRVPVKMNAIEAARSRFANCDFDEAACKDGLFRLRHYRKEWDDAREVFRDKPRHDANSHGADAFMTFATGYAPAVKAEPINYPKRTYT